MTSSLTLRWVTPARGAAAKSEKGMLGNAAGAEAASALTAGHLIPVSAEVAVLARTTPLRWRMSVSRRRARRATLAFVTFLLFTNALTAI